MVRRLAERRMNHPVASERFARHALGTRYDDLSDDAVLQAKTFILDTIGVGIAGSSAAGADELSQVSAGWGEGAEACVWGRRKRVPAPTAAFLNGFQVHCQEYDCLHEKAVLHAMATLLPATIAYAERMGGVSGRELIAAVVVGIDVAVNLGVAAREGLKFFRPATSGGFGATAAIARLGRFDLDTLCNAFGIQYGQTSGTMQAHAEGSIVSASTAARRYSPAIWRLADCRVRATCSRDSSDTCGCTKVRGTCSLRGPVSVELGWSANLATSPIRLAARPTAALRESWRCVGSGRSGRMKSAP